MTVHDDAQLISLKVSDDFNPWCAAGFNVVESNQGTSTTHIGEVLLRFQEEPLEQGIYAIGTKNLEGVFDGLTFFVDPGTEGRNGEQSNHPNYVSRIDHLVVTTSDCDRTTQALETAGIEARRVRAFGKKESKMRQTFFWLGDVILELVGPDTKSGDEPATIWGLALISDQIEKTVEFYGEAATQLKPAVQPGRFITTVKTRNFGITDALAIMTPH